MQNHWACCLFQLFFQPFLLFLLFTYSNFVPSLYTISNTNLTFFSVNVLPQPKKSFGYLFASPSFLRWETASRILCFCYCKVFKTSRRRTEKTPLYIATQLSSVIHRRFNQCKLHSSGYCWTIDQVQVAHVKMARHSCFSINKKLLGHMKDNFH